MKSCNDEVFSLEMKLYWLKSQSGYEGRVVTLRIVLGKLFMVHKFACKLVKMRSQWWLKAPMWNYMLSTPETSSI